MAYDRYLDQFLEEPCALHGEAVPCRECEVTRQLRLRNERLLREHKALPIRRPKKLEPK